MNDELSPGKTALARAAERLIGERGFHGVTARDVIKAAGHRNNSAITYHFGSWDALLDTVWRLHALPVNAERAAILARERVAGPLELRTLLRAYLDPLVAEIARHRPSHWARFNEQWLAAAPLEMTVRPGVAGPSREHNPDTDELWVLGDLLEEISSRLTQLPEPARRRRVALMCRFVITSLAAAERDREVGDGDGGEAGQDAGRSWAALADELGTLAMALLEAPQA
ncbi:TetR/AcrR family transcriptional regulator [Rhodococcus sp. D2-41]|uniref:TetR/AcrR family transcriptional regulator n=1 Tax=Speluncibacter jeojiensis TaxID=2710754 RepID=A0A9X4M3J3_9ACTN|nr:TetR/AcrR family transcriptional regulator [Rhodococcus sp. D2-41]MDG3008875.1 TetR/AcrR family transcriptional regulator [Rhodococcus sp. D2-41]MDG3016496.1 TetR/AcrR family transcriptional regulator [Corynebacteriales bacterium D3-21]